MRIAVLGTGRVGSALAGALLAKHEVSFGSRDPENHQDAPAPVLDLATAISGAEVVINATPGVTALETLGALKTVLAGKILLDVSNAVTQSFELMYPNSSLAAHLQEALPATRVVKSLNTVNTSVMASPQALPSRTTIFVSGNDSAAKAAVSGLLADIGWSKESQLDLGDIGSARAAEHYFLLFAAAARALRTPKFNVAIVM